MMSHWIKVSRRWTIHHKTNKRRDNGSNYTTTDTGGTDTFHCLISVSQLGYTEHRASSASVFVVNIFTLFYEMKTVECGWPAVVYCQCQYNKTNHVNN